MNAYDIAKDLDREGKFPGHVCYGTSPLLVRAANMLRKQADRIAELEKKGEPVAWMEYIQDEEWEVWYTEPTDLPEGHSYKPLYLAPQTKPLSNEEINKLIVNKVTDYELCRAIEERHGIK